MPPLFHLMPQFALLRGALPGRQRLAIEAGQLVIRGSVDHPDTLGFQCLVTAIGLHVALAEDILGSLVPVAVHGRHRAPH